LVQGGHWIDSGDKTLLRAELEWIQLVILALFAYASGQSRSTGTKTFRSGIEVLRQAKIQWVSDLEVGLSAASELITRTLVEIYWHSAEDILLCSKDVIEKPNALAEGLSTMIWRADLEPYLKLVFNKFADIFSVSHEDAVSTLQEVHISSDRLAEIE